MPAVRAEYRVPTRKRRRRTFGGGEVSGHVGYEPVKSASAKKESPLVPRDGKGQSKFDVPGRRIDRRNIAPDEAESGATRADDAGGHHPGLGDRRSLGRQADLLDGYLHAGQCRRSEEHTSELQSLMRISYAVFCLTKKRN